MLGRCSGCRGAGEALDTRGPETQGWRLDGTVMPEGLGRRIMPAG